LNQKSRQTLKQTMIRATACTLMLVTQSGFSQDTPPTYLWLSEVQTQPGANVDYENALRDISVAAQQVDGAAQWISFSNQIGTKHSYIIMRFAPSVEQASLGADFETIASTARDTGKNRTLAASLDEAVASSRSRVLLREDKLSYDSDPDHSAMRYVEMELSDVRPDHHVPYRSFLESLSSAYTKHNWTGSIFSYSTVIGEQDQYVRFRLLNSLADLQADMPTLQAPEGSSKVAEQSSLGAGFIAARTATRTSVWRVRPELSHVVVVEP